MHSIKSGKITHTVLETLKIPVESKKGERACIPTTLVPLSPEKIFFENNEADLLFGLFHIMWRDMPRRRVYKLRLLERISFAGEYIGSSLVCHNPDKKILSLDSDWQNY